MPTTGEVYAALAAEAAGLRFQVKRFLRLLREAGVDPPGSLAGAERTLHQLEETMAEQARQAAQ
jgi:hypothetical protein